MTRARIVEVALVVTLLSAMVAQAWSSLERISVTTDEHTHLPAGYTYWATRDFRLNRQHPPLCKLVGAAPLLWRDLSAARAWRYFEAAPRVGNTFDQEWFFGETFLFEDNPNAVHDGTVSAARRAMIVFALILALAVYWWSRTLFGVAGGLISLALVAFSPNLLAHARLVNTDMAMAAFYVAVPAAEYAWIRRPAWWRDVLVGALLGAALAAKYSSLLLVPVLGLMLVVAFFKPPPTDEPANIHRPLGPGPWWRRALGLAVHGLPVMATAGLVVWASYLFSEPPTAWLDGYALVYADVAPGASRFMLGEYSGDGFASYFLVTFLFKTPLPTLALLGIIGALLWLRRAEPPDVVATVTLVAAPVLLVVAMTLRAEQIGHRYILGVYPFVFIAAGIVGPSLSVPGWPRRVAAAGVVLATLAVIGGVRAYPFYLPFHNSLAGSDLEFFEVLDDSNNDWYQGWKEVARLQESGELSPLRVHASPQARRRIRYGGQLSFEPISTAPGLHAMPAFEYFRTRGPIRQYPVSRVIAGSVVIIDIRVTETRRQSPAPP